MYVCTYVLYLWHCTVGLACLGCVYLTIMVMHEAGSLTSKLHLGVEAFGQQAATACLSFTYLRTWFGMIPVRIPYFDPSQSSLHNPVLVVGHKGFIVMKHSSCVPFKLVTRKDTVRPLR